MEHFHLDLGAGFDLFVSLTVLPGFALLSVVILLTIWAGRLRGLLSPGVTPCPSAPPGLRLALSPTVLAWFLLWRTLLAMSSNKVSTWSPDLEEVSAHLQPSWMALV